MAKYKRNIVDVHIVHTINDGHHSRNRIIWQF